MRFGHGFYARSMSAASANGAVASSCACKGAFCVQYGDAVTLASLLFTLLTVAGVSVVLALIVIAVLRIIVGYAGEPGSGSTCFD